MIDVMLAVFTLWRREIHVIQERNCGSCIIPSRKNITLLVTNTTEESPSREATSCSATQEIPGILRNAKFHYRVHTSPQLVPALIQINPFFI
jgi:hypothetical protein